jgi:predicted ester cyclase
MQTVSRVVLSVALLAGCKKKDEAAKPADKPSTTATPDKPATPEKPAAPAMPTGEELAKRYQDCWGYFNAKDYDNFKTCYAPGVVSDFVDSGMPPATGWDEVHAKHDAPIDEALPDRKGTVELTLINGSNGVTIALFTGTHTGTFKTPAGDIPATNKKVGLQVAHAVHFADGKSVDKEWYFQDAGTMLAQLGVSKAPARPASDKPWPTSETVIAKDDDTEKRNLENTKKLNDIFNKHDMKAFAEMLGDGLVWSEIGVPMDWDKKTAITAHEDMMKGFSDLSITTTTMWAAGDYVVMTGIFAGTNDGDVKAMGLKKTGKKVSLDYLQLYKWDKDGKLVGSWGFWNSAAFAMQLGLAPPPAGK